MEFENKDESIMIPYYAQVFFDYLSYENNLFVTF